MYGVYNMYLYVYTCNKDSIWPVSVNFHKIINALGTPSLWIVFHTEPYIWLYSDHWFKKMQPLNSLESINLSTIANNSKNHKDQFSPKHLEIYFLFWFPRQKICVLWCEKLYNFDIIDLQTIPKPENTHTLTSSTTF